MLGKYIKSLLSVSLRASWTLANGLLGALLGGVAMNWYGVLPVFQGTSSLATNANWATSFFIYGIGVWVALLFLTTIVVSPFKIWLNNEKVVDKKRIRLALAALMHTGSELMGRAVGDDSIPFSEINTIANEWADKTEQIIRDNLDDSYIARFRDGSSLPMTALYFPPIGNEDKRRSLWGGLRIRVARLDEFIKELSTNG